MKFVVNDGRVKDCILETKESGKKYWVTPKKKWLVAHEDGTPMDGCEVYVEPVGEVEEIESEAIERPDDSWYVADIKAWLDGAGMAYTSSMLKADLLELANG